MISSVQAVLFIDLTCRRLGRLEAMMGYSRGAIPARNWIACGLLFGFGFSVLVGALTYEQGTLRAMGPGYFPAMLGGTLCFVSLLILVEDIAIGFQAGEPLPGITWNSAKSVLGPIAGILAFALTIRNLGFVPATSMCALLAGLGHPRNHLIEIAVIAALVSALSSVVFVFALGIPVRLFAF